MSQVIRKYDSGGKTEKPKLFSISGLGDFDQNALIERGYRDVDDYISKKGLKGSMASNFRNAVQYMLEGINNGTLTMDAMGNFQDKTGRASSTGELDRKKFLGIKTGIKDTDNNAYGIAADYLHGLVMNSPKYKQPEKKIEKFNINDYLAKEISKRWYGGNKIDFNNWFKNRSEQDRNTLIGEIFSSADYNQLYNDYDWTDTGINSAEDLATRGKAFSAAISNNELNKDDYNTFATLGGSGLDKYMKEDSTQTEPTPEQAKMKAWETEAEAAGATTPEAKEAFIQKKQREEADRNAAIIKESKDDVYRRERDAFFNDYAAKNPFRETIQSGYAPSSLSYKPEDYDKPIRDFYNNDIDQYLNDNLSRDWFKAGNGQHIANHMDYIINHLGMALPDAGDGFVAIPSTFDYNNYTTMVYNPTTRQYKEVSMLVNDALRRLANTYYDSTHTPKRKNGGVLYMQFGGTYSAGANYSRYQQKRELEKKTRDEEAAKQRAESSGRTVEEQKIADRKPGSITSGNWTGEDYTRLASIVADIGSMGAAYIPVYGTAASAVLGAGSSLANYGADLSENGFKWGDLGNLVTNLGLDTVGLIPGLGTAAKGSKMLKTAIKYIPRTLSLLAAYNYTGPAIESMKKALTPGTDLTVDDWRNIAEGFKLVLQGGKGVKRTVQARNLKKDLATGNKVLTTLGGKEVTLTPAELSEIRSHRKVEDQQAALQLLKKDDNLQLVGDLNKRWFNPSRYLPNSNIRNEYNFGKTVKKKTSQGLIEVPRVYSNSDKYIAAAMQQDVARVPGLDELLIKYNDWKYGVKSQKPKSKPTKQKSKKKKKTSRDDRATKKEFGGILLREGGLIPKYQGGNVMQRGTKGSWLNNENTYKDATNLGAWDSYYDMNKIIDDINTSRLLVQQNADEFINTLNGLASQNLPWKKQLNARGYKNWNQLYKTTGFNKYFGEDEGRFDYLGPSTWNRRLFLQTLGSRYNSPENALSVGNDKIWYGDGTWKKVEKTLSEPDAEEKVEVVTGQKQAETPATNATTGRRITLPDATSKKFSIHPEDALALGRMVGGLVTNNRAAKLYKEGLKPTLLDTFENYVPLQGNFQAKTSGEQQAGSIQSLAAMPRTSDASLQLAGELDATDRAAQARMQGDLADAERFYQTRMLGQQESDAAKARRVEVANKNRAAINAIDAAKKQIDAGRVTANYQQVLAPWLAGVENQFRQNRAMKNQLALETYQNRASSEYDLALAKILEDYKDDPVGRQKALNQLRSEASANLLKERSKLIDSPWLIQFGEKGTKLTYKEKAMLQRAKDFNKRLADDNKQFHKDIMESKREHNKLIMNMSALTAALIKKGMQL